MNEPLLTTSTPPITVLGTAPGAAGTGRTAATVGIDAAGDGIPDPRRLLRVAALIGSVRRGSLNRALFRAALGAAPDDVVLEPVAIERLPFYDGDLEAADASPDVRAFRAAIAAADAVLVVTPEYNRSLPAVVKNAIDWASRPRSSAAIAGKPVLLIGATPGMGAVRHALDHAAAVLAFAGAVPFERRLGVADAARLLDPDGDTPDPGLREDLADLLASFAAGLRSEGRAEVAA